MKKILELQEQVLTLLANDKLDNFYLAGGTALSLFYFEHRGSFDLDFFTKNFSEKKIKEIITYLSEELDVEIAVVASQLGDKMARIMVYSVPIRGTEEAMKLDFVEDSFELLEPLKNKEGIPTLSLSDIYLRKIYTACGSFMREDEAGRNKSYGGRQEAKDFFDLYHLSKTHMPLSEFAKKYCGPQEKESLVIWYRTYDRDTIKMGLLDVITTLTIDYREMDKHFKDEIDKMILAEICEEL